MRRETFPFAYKYCKEFTYHMFSGQRLQPLKNPFDGISKLPVSTLVYTDINGVVQPLNIGNSLQINNGQLDVVLSSSIFNDTLATNIGTGTGLFSFKDGNTLKFKSLVGNPHLIITNDANTVYLNVVNVAELNHTHLISDVINLQTVLDSLSPTSHTHDDRYSLLSHIHANASSSVNGFMSISDFNKLQLIENEATKNQTDAYLLDLTNHTGILSNNHLTANIQQLGDIVFSNNDYIKYHAGTLKRVDISDVKTDLQINNVDNTSDIDKPISTATQNALNNKEDTIPFGNPGEFLSHNKTWVPVTKNTVGLGNLTNDLQLRAADLSNDETLSADSPTFIPSQHAVKTFVDTHDWDGGYF